MTRKKIALVFITAAFVLFSLGYVAVTKGVPRIWPLVERWLFSGLADVKTSSTSTALLAEINAFREISATLPPARAASEWVALWDRTHSSLRIGEFDGMHAFDRVTGHNVDQRSVIAALPPPSAWGDINEIAAKRKADNPKDVNALGLFLVAQILTSDKANIGEAVGHFERLLAGQQPDNPDLKLAVARARATITKIYGTREEIVDSAMALIALHGAEGSTQHATLPDLVGLVGEDKATTLLTQALKQPVTLDVDEGNATRALAQKVALANMDSLAAPQWALIQNLGSLQLYEAMQARFDAPTSTTKASLTEKITKKITTTLVGDYDYARRQADQYYFLDLVVAGRHADAERAMEKLTRANNNSFEVPRRAMTALIKNGQNEPVYQFLATLLESRPETPAWDAYLQQAAYLNRAPAAIALLDKILARRDLPATTRRALVTKRVDALLGADLLDEALIGLREMMSQRGTVDANDRNAVASAIRLAAIGRVLNQPSVATSGLDTAVKLFSAGSDKRDYKREATLRALLAELRVQGRATELKEVAQRELTSDMGDSLASAMFEHSMRIADRLADRRAALTELVGLASAAGEHSEVLRHVDAADAWAAADLAEIADEKDSQGVTLGAMVARALIARGNTDAAKRVTKALLDKAPGNDQGYQLAVDLYGEDVLPLLAARHALDQFEERPLIWMAFVYLKAGKLSDAESTIRRAIAIDPSDGEQGTNDRMRAYGVLADILAAKGDVAGANNFRRAVAAIRQSEKADALYALGLYQRAFAGYRAALAEFSDAYCIQSRLAVQLAKQGQHSEALKHYTRAYELMPDSFGRIESHCFGCENVFGGGEAQRIAERVFTDIVLRAPQKPQAHYMLGYLRKEQGKLAEAVPLFRQAVALDAAYLNAWKNLNELGKQTYIEAAERDIVRFRLLDLDPRQRHVHYELDEVANLTALWQRVGVARPTKIAGDEKGLVYPLQKSAAEQKKRFENQPAGMAEQLENITNMTRRHGGTPPEKSIGGIVANHALMDAAQSLILATHYAEAIASQPTK